MPSDPPAIASIPVVPTVPDPPSLKTILRAVSHLARWGILRELSSGEELQVIDLARRLHRTPDYISKHCAILRAAGLAVIGRAGLYTMPTRFILDREQRIVDLAHCVLRLKQEPPV